MTIRNTHGNKSIDEILKSINELITSKVKNDLGEPEIEDELCLTEVIDESEDKTTKSSEESRAQTISILEDFVETAKILNQVPSEDGIKTQANDSTKHSVEELVIEMLKPQIKSWLDSNLPIMVKQVVSDEIKSLVANIRKYKD